jgi:hypothetical protein
VFSAVVFKGDLLAVCLGIFRLLFSMKFIDVGRTPLGVVALPAGIGDSTSTGRQGFYVCCCTLNKPLAMHLTVYGKPLKLSVPLLIADDLRVIWWLPR